jgi:hypothetical protein
MSGVVAFESKCRICGWAAKRTCLVVDRLFKARRIVVASACPWESWFCFLGCIVWAVSIARRCLDVVSALALVVLSSSAHEMWRSKRVASLRRRRRRAWRSRALRWALCLKLLGMGVGWGSLGARENCCLLGMVEVCGGSAA